MPQATKHCTWRSQLPNPKTGEGTVPVFGHDRPDEPTTKTGQNLHTAFISRLREHQRKRHTHVYTNTYNWRGIQLAERTQQLSIVLHPVRLVACTATCRQAKSAMNSIKQISQHMQNLYKFSVYQTFVIF